jgi:hypothetical protein
MNQFKNDVVQPIIAAAGKEMGRTVEDLLAHGADPSTLERSAHNIIQHPQTAWHSVAESLLDIIQKKLRALRKWKEPTYGRPNKPEQLRDESSYTAGLTFGTYAYWTAQRDYQAMKYTNDKGWDDWNKYTEPKPEDGLEEKKAAILKLILELEHAEKALIAAGGKTFAQLHPDIPEHQESSQQVIPDPKPTFYETKLRFRVPDLNDTKKDGYLKLFEAAWNNDLEVIKAMTLAPWSLETASPLHRPLKIAVQDGNGFSPFSIAVLRNHRDLAGKIVEICLTQYHEDDGSSSRKRFRTSDGDDEVDSDNENRKYPPQFLYLPHCLEILFTDLL